MNSGWKFPLIIIAAMVIVGVGAYALIRSRSTATQAQQTHNPTIRPADFVEKIDNIHFPLVPGTTFVLRGTRSGETDTMVVTGETRMVMGVKTTVVLDRAFNKNNELVEETYDWYAQDKNGNVWYFGEDSKAYKEGKVTSTAGSWEAGKNGALPGIIMKKNTQIGESWRQEYAKGVAEDMAEVVSTGETVTVPAGTYHNCIKTRDWDSLKLKLRPSIENKYYCPDAGMVLETVAGGLGRLELISIQHR